MYLILLIEKKIFRDCKFKKYFICLFTTDHTVDTFVDKNGVKSKKWEDLT